MKKNIGSYLTPSQWVILSLWITYTLNIAYGGLIETTFPYYQYIPAVLGYLLFILIPGYLIIDLWLEERTLAKICLSVGVGLMMLMGIGAILNISSRIITNPLRFRWLFPIFSAILAILSVANPTPSKGLDRTKISIKSIFVLIPVLLASTALLAGVYVLRTGGSNTFAIAAILLISLLVVNISRDLNSGTYAAVVLILSYTLLTMNTISFEFVIGGADSHVEYHFAKTVADNNFWSPSIRGNVNSLLSVTVLPAILSSLLDMSINDVLRVVYPGFFSMVPLTGYVIYKEKISKNKAFYSSLLIIFGFYFYRNSIGIRRQQVAVLFLSLLVLISILNNTKFEKRLTVSFIFGLIVSHYGTTMIGFFTLVMSVLLIYALKMLNTCNIAQFAAVSLPQRRTILRPVPIAMVGVGNFVWQIYATNQGFLKAISGIVRSLAITIVRAESNSQTLAVLSSRPPITQQFTKFLFITLIIFIGIGLLVNILENQEQTNEMYWISVALFIIMCSTLVLPFLFFGVQRILGIGIVFFAPYAVIGFDKIFEIIKRNISQNSNRGVELYISIFLVIFLLFNAGVVHEITGISPTSPAISQNTIETQSVSEKFSYYKNYDQYTEDVSAARWLNSYTQYQDDGLYSDGLSSFVIISYGGAGPGQSTWYFNGNKQISAHSSFSDNSYIYLSCINNRGEIMAKRGLGITPKVFSTSDIKDNTTKKAKVFSGGCSTIYSPSDY